ALDDELVAPADHLKIGKSNLRLSSTLKSKEHTLQVVLDALKLTSFYNAFEISTDIPEIYMQEFWVTISRHHSSLRFKLNGKSHTVNVDNFRDMLKICPKLLGQKFEEPLLEEDILSFIRDLGHTGEIKFLFDVNVNRMHQPWRSFATIINKCLSGKTTALKSLRLIKSSAKGDKAAKKKQPVETFMDKGADEGTGVKLGVPDVPSYNYIDEQISWKSSNEEDDDEVSLNDNDDDVANLDDENQDDDNEQTDSDNEGDDFVHPKFSTHDDDTKQDKEVNEEDSFDPRVQTPSHVESSDDESNKESDEEVQGANTEEEEMEEEATHEEDEANELYRDVNVNLEGRDTVITDALLPNVQATQETEDTHVILTALINPEGQQQSYSMSSGFVSNMLNPKPDTCIDSIFYLNTEATSLVDVLVTTIAELPLVFAITLPPPPTPLITHMQKTPVPTPTIVPSSSLQDLPNFSCLFEFDHN
ncbi:hypothetical protein Tco_1072446, partial [Tanacetum coccineum]